MQFFGMYSLKKFSCPKIKLILISVFSGCTSTMTWPSSIDVYLHFSKEHQSMEQRRNPTEFFKCDIGGCNLKFPTRHELNKHRNHKHEEMFKFQCDICAKRLATNKLLKVHLIQHSGEKPFHCKHCDYKAITTSLGKRNVLFYEIEFYSYSSLNLFWRLLIG